METREWYFHWFCSGSLLLKRNTVPSPNMTRYLGKKIINDVWLVCEADRRILTLPIMHHGMLLHFHSTLPLQHGFSSAHTHTDAHTLTLCIPYRTVYTVIIIAVLLPEHESTTWLCRINTPAAFTPELYSRPGSGFRVNYRHFSKVKVVRRRWMETKRH